MNDDGSHGQCQQRGHLFSCVSTWVCINWKNQYFMTSLYLLSSNRVLSRSTVLVEPWQNGFSLTLVYVDFERPGVER